MSVKDTLSLKTEFSFVIENLHRLLSDAGNWNTEAFIAYLWETKGLLVWDYKHKKIKLLV